MPMIIAAVNAGKPRVSAYKLADSKGLYLLISPSGGRLWRMHYRFLGHQKALTVVSYPDVSLARAREKRSDARSLLVDGVDPLECRKAKRRNPARKTNVSRYESEKDTSTGPEQIIQLRHAHSRETVTMGPHIDIKSGWIACRRKLVI